MHVATCRNLPILGNTFLENRELPIDLSVSSRSDGPTSNDPGDVDASGAGPQVAGGNRLQNTLGIISIADDMGSDQLRLSVRVDSTPTSAAYPLRIDIYHDDALGTYPIATRTYAPASAQQPIDIVLPLSTTGSRLSFGVTDADGNSSEMLRIGDLFDDGFESVPLGHVD